MNNKNKFLVLSFICLIIFSVAPVLATTDEGSNNSTIDNSTNNTGILPTVDFTASVTEGSAPLNVFFTTTCTGNPTEFWWNFGDGSYSPQLNEVGHTYMNQGKYNVSLQVTNSNGSNTATKLEYITVDEKVNNSTTVSNVVPTTPCACSTDNNSSTNNNTNDNNKTYTNNTTSACNISKNVTANLRILCKGKAPNRVHFIDRSKNHVSIFWNLGDGVTSKCKSITHIYKTPGKYLVKFTVKYRSGKYKTVYGGYIVVTGSSPQPVVNNTTNATQPTPTPEPTVTPTPVITPTPTPTQVVTPVPTPVVTPTTTPTPIPTPVPTPTVTPTPGSQVIASWNGSADQKTETFHISSDQWKISWTTQVVNFGYVHIVAYNPDGTFKAEVENTDLMDTDYITVNGAGDYYLKISANQPYTITVEQ